MRKITISVVSFLMVLILAFGLDSTVAKAATDTVTAVKITAPVVVQNGKTGSYTLYQLPGKNTTKIIKAKATIKGKASNTIYFESSNKAIATVGTTTGKVTTKADKYGTVTIKAYAKANKKKFAKIEITVAKFEPKFKNEIPAKAIVDETKDVSLVPTGNGIKSTTYSTSDETVAAISTSGKVTFKKEGKVTLKAIVESKSGVSKTLTKTITVYERPTKDTIKYANVKFDYNAKIKYYLGQHSFLPAAANNAPFTISDEKNSDGVMLVDAANHQSYYMNALVAGHKLTIVNAEGATINSVSSSVGTAITEDENGFSFVPAPLSANDIETSHETITVNATFRGTTKDYTVHMMTEKMPKLEVVKNSVAKANKGVYSFTLDKVLLRVNTDGEIVYYRDMNCWGHDMCENLAPQLDGEYFSFFCELVSQYRNSQGGFSSGVYVVMDKDYKVIDTVNLYENKEKNHVHGKGFLDQHEFVMLEEGHYLLLSYTKLLVDNLPFTEKGVNGTSKAYVWAGIMQEVKDGKVVAEINTADYPLLYQSAVEKCDYANSTDQGMIATFGQAEKWCLSEGWMDYVHVNSLDYTLNDDGTVNKLLVSMRDQCATYQFDMKSGKIDWILGGKASTLKGYEAYTTKRVAQDGEEFDAFTYGQHYARYCNRDASGKLTGNPVVSIFDNQTGDGPFVANPPAPVLAPNKTRVLKATINESTKTVEVSDVITGEQLDAKEDYAKYHNASHCGSVDYFNKNSVLIGWGLHAAIDNIPSVAGPFVGIDDGKHFQKLKQGDRAVFTEYDMESGKITFELSGDRNKMLLDSWEGFFSYRTYKSTK